MSGETRHIEQRLVKLRLDDLFPVAGCPNGFADSADRTTGPTVLIDECPARPE